jgi:hypothetical protein
MSQASAYSRILAASCWNVWSGQPSGGQVIVDLRVPWSRAKDQDGFAQFGEHFLKLVQL